MEPGDSLRLAKLSMQGFRSQLSELLSGVNKYLERLGR